MGFSDLVLVSLPVNVIVALITRVGPHGLVAPTEAVLESGLVVRVLTLGSIP